jgi:hypothetical protein
MINNLKFIYKVITMAKYSSTRSKNISKAMSGGNHPRSLLWTVQDPRGHIYITKDIKALCTKYEIPYSTLRLKHQQKYTGPIWSGKAKGWAVLGTEMVPYHKHLV